MTSACVGFSKENEQFYPCDGIHTPHKKERNNTFLWSEKNATNTINNIMVIQFFSVCIFLMSHKSITRTKTVDQKRNSKKKIHSLQRIETSLSFMKFESHFKRIHTHQAKNDFNVCWLISFEANVNVLLFCGNVHIHCRQTDETICVPRENGQSHTTVEWILWIYFNSFMVRKKKKLLNSRYDVIWFHDKR